MTLLERIEYFVAAAQSQDDPQFPEDIINNMTPHQLLSEISDALQHAGVVFNKEW